MPPASDATLLGERLESIIDTLPADALTLAELRDALWPGWPNCSLPRCSPSFFSSRSLSRVSTAGAAILLIGICRLFNRSLWPPRRVLARPLPPPACAKAWAKALPGSTDSSASAAPPLALVLCHRSARRNQRPGLYPRRRAADDALRPDPLQQHLASHCPTAPGHWLSATRRSLHRPRSPGQPGHNSLFWPTAFRRRTCLEGRSGKVARHIAHTERFSSVPLGTITSACSRPIILPLSQMASFYAKLWLFGGALPQANFQGGIRCPERHYLTSLFEPKSVAVIGASERERIRREIYCSAILLTAATRVRFIPDQPALRKHPRHPGLQIGRRRRRKCRTGDHRHQTEDRARREYAAAAG